jgi:hypothetical protein
MIKIAYTGSHGCGKTTSVYKSAHKKKIEEPNKIINLLTEVARKSPFPINRETTINSQKWIFYTQLKEELEEEESCDILICDRTIIDVLAYSRVSGFEKMITLFYPIAQEHLKTYDEIYFLSLKNNDYYFPDGIRDNDSSFRLQIEVTLLNLYYELGKNIPNWDKKFFIV